MSCLRITTHNFEYTFFTVRGRSNKTLSFFFIYHVYFEIFQMHQNANENSNTSVCFNEKKSVIRSLNFFFN